MNVFYVAICSILELLKKFIEAVNKIASIDCFVRQKQDGEFVFQNSILLLLRVI